MDDKTTINVSIEKLEDLNVNTVYSGHDESFFNDNLNFAPEN